MRLKKDHGYFPTYLFKLTKIIIKSCSFTIYIFLEQFICRYHWNCNSLLHFQQNVLNINRNHKIMFKTLNFFNYKPIYKIFLNFNKNDYGRTVCWAQMLQQEFSLTYNANIKQPTYVIFCCLIQIWLVSMLQKKKLQFIKISLLFTIFDIISYCLLNEN